jgi:hypothetical protein
MPAGIWAVDTVHSNVGLTLIAEAHAPEPERLAA